MCINANHFEKVSKALTEAQGSARVRLYTAEKAQGEIAELEKYVRHALPATRRPEIKAYLANWGTSSKDFQIQGTVIAVERGAKDWFITKILRTYKPSTTPRIACDNLSEETIMVLRHHALNPVPRLSL